MHIVFLLYYLGLHDKGNNIFVFYYFIFFFCFFFLSCMKKEDFFCFMPSYFSLVSARFLYANLIFYCIHIYFTFLCFYLLVFCYFEFILYCLCFSFVLVFLSGSVLYYINYYLPVRPACHLVFICIHCALLFCIFMLHTHHLVCTF